MLSIIYTVELYYTQLQAEMPAADGTKWRWAVQVSLPKKNNQPNTIQQLQNVLVEKLWPVYSPHYEIIIIKRHIPTPTNIAMMAIHQFAKMF